MKLIGQGSSASVYQDLTTGMVYKIHTSRSGYLEERNTLEKIINLNMKSPIEIYGFNDEQNSIIMEFCGDNLENHIISDKIKDLETRIYLVNQVFGFYRELKKNRVVHGDFKAKNMVINKYNVIKLIDFDMSYVAEANEAIDEDDDHKKCEYVILQLMFGLPYKRTYPQYKKLIAQLKHEYPAIYFTLREIK